MEQRFRADKSNLIEIYSLSRERQRLSFTATARKCRNKSLEAQVAAEESEETH